MSKYSGVGLLIIVTICSITSGCSSEYTDYASGKFPEFIIRGEQYSHKVLYEGKSTRSGWRGYVVSLGLVPPHDENNWCLQVEIMHSNTIRPEKLRVLDNAGHEFNIIDAESDAGIITTAYHYAEKEASRWIRFDSRSYYLTIEGSYVDEDGIEHEYVSPRFYPKMKYRKRSVGW